MPLHITALGSSFAAGISIPPQSGPKAASRSENNYAHLLAKKLDAKLTDQTISGATLKSIAFESQTANGYTFPPQIEGLDEDVDIVTITAGGNDMRYVGNLFLDSINGYLLGRALMGTFAYFFPEKMVAKGISEEETTKLYIEVLDKIHAKAPRARIFVVEYLLLLGDDTRAGVDAPLSEEQVKQHKEIGERLKRATRKAAEARKEWCECVSMHELSAKHGIGSEEPWVEGFGLGLFARGVAPYHPNALGHQAVADILYEKLKR